MSINEHEHHCMEWNCDIFNSMEKDSSSAKEKNQLHPLNTSLLTAVLVYRNYGLPELPNLQNACAYCQQY